jgi:hypothetical protein
MGWISEKGALVAKWCWWWQRKGMLFWLSEGGWWWRLSVKITYYHYCAIQYYWNKTIKEDHTFFLSLALTPPPLNPAPPPPAYIGKASTCNAERTKSRRGREWSQKPTTAKKAQTSYYLLNRGFFSIFLYFIQPLLHLLPLRLHCVRDCWDRARGCCDFRHCIVRRSNHALGCRYKVPNHKIPNAQSS